MIKRVLDTLKAAALAVMPKSNPNKDCMMIGMKMASKTLAGNVGKTKFPIAKKISQTKRLRRNS